MKTKIFFMILAIFAFLVSPVFAYWEIQDPQYSGKVFFFADGTGYVDTGLWYQDFTYVNTGSNTWTVKSMGYSIPIAYDPKFGNISSTVRPGSQLVWVEEPNYK